MFVPFGARAAAESSRSDQANQEAETERSNSDEYSEAKTGRKTPAIGSPTSISLKASSTVCFRRNGSRGGTDESAEWLVRGTRQLHGDVQCLLA